MSGLTLLLTPPGGCSHYYLLHLVAVLALPHQEPLYSGDENTNKNKNLLQLHLHHCLILDFSGTSSYHGGARMNYMFTKWEKYFLTCHTPSLSVSWIHRGVHLEMAQSTPLLAQFIPRYRGVHLANTVAKLSLRLFSPDFTPRIQRLSGQENQYIKYTSPWSDYISTYTPLLLPSSNVWLNWFMVQYLQCGVCDRMTV